LKGPPQQELDLTVQAAKVVGRPVLERLEHPGIEPEQERLPLRHGPAYE
jgi:hypothetical protein